MTIEELINNPGMLEIGRKAVEDTLVDFRDSRISQMRGNGLVIKEVNGDPSSVIRMGIDMAMIVALKAIKGAVDGN